ncbi:MAG: endo-1,4-beta-xylanase [Acidobacteriia bacterium]|nr:endo-1,4-beta-xylanase [Terriglobia bacterium]
MRKLLLPGHHSIWLLPEAAQYPVRVLFATSLSDFPMWLFRSRPRRIALAFLALVGLWGAPDCHAAALSPRSGWTFAPGAEDLIQAGSWSCVSQVTANPNSLTITAAASYVTPINTSGPRLLVQGDFSVLATLSAPASTGTFLTLVGTLQTGTAFWTGLKRLDVGTANGSISVNYWMGDSPNAVATGFPLPPGAGDPINLEVARIGSQIVVFVNGSEAGRLADPGIFGSGQVYLGFNAAPQNTLTVLALAAAVPAGGSSKVSLSSSYLQVIPRTGSALRDLAGQRGFLVGAAVNPSLLSIDAYARTLGGEFNLVVPENAMKFAETEPARDQYNFCAADQIVAFAQANGMKIRGHNLVWQQDLPAWLTNGKFSSDEAAKILQDHIVTVAGRYKGKLIAWDVVNEAIAYGPPYDPQPSYWLTTLGSGYIDQAFRWAHDADPFAKLFYNDTGGEGLGAKSDAVYNLVQGLISRGVPIDGVGLQMHTTTTGAPSVDSISANIKRLGALGLEVHITEMDVRVPVPASASDLAAQATVYKNVASACLANSNCTALLTWGVSDANSWIPGAYPGFGAALLFDQQFQPKPAWQAVAGLFAPPPGSVQISNGGIVIHGGTSPNVSPGSLVDVYGSNLATLPVSAPADAATLPVTLGGVQVAINGIPAPLVYVSPSLIILQVPYSTAVGSATTAVISNGTSSGPAPMNVQAAAPSILIYRANRAVAQNQDGSTNSSSNCAAVGTYATAYLIGSGPLDNPIPTGAVAPTLPLSSETLTTTVTLGGTAAPLIFAGMTPTSVGLMQVDFQVPSLPAGDLPLQVTIGTAQSNQPLFCVGH